MRYIYGSWNDLAGIELCERSSVDFSVRLKREVSKGPTAFSLQVETPDGGWDASMYEGEVFHLTADQIMESSESGLLRQIMGVEEVSKALGIEKREFAVMVQRGQFIKPAMNIAASPIWLRPDVEAWKRENPDVMKPRKKDKGDK